MTQDDRWDLLFTLDDLARNNVRTDVREASTPPLRPGEVRLAVERVALTMNNVTYARLGDSETVPFWSAFPAPAGYGRVPTWGFAVVEESRQPEVTEGSRYHGYLPLSTHLTVAAEPTARGFRDTLPHRESLHDWYRTFRPAGPRDVLDNERTLVWPVYPASYNLGDFALGSVESGARSVLVTSASSKTAIGLAHRLSKVDELTTVGLTSSRNADFVAGLGVYDTVAPYADTGSVPVDTPVVFIDFTGAHATIRSVYRRFAGKLAQAALVGYTHPAARLEPPEITAPEPVIFFTPAVEEETVAKEGPDHYHARYDRAEQEYVEHCASWLRVRHGHGPEAMADVFRSLLAGEQRPDTGNVLSPR